MLFTSSMTVVSVTLMAATVLLVLVLASSHLASKLNVDSVGAGATGRFQIASAANAVKGQRDALFEVTGLSTTPLVGDALGFTTTGMGYL